MNPRHVAAALVLACTALAALPCHAEDYIQRGAAGLLPASVAVLEWRNDLSVEVLRIDDTDIDAVGSRWSGSGRAVLLPGRHEVALVGVHGGSPLKCGMFSKLSATLKVILRAGRRYEARSDKSSISCTVYLWIEEPATDTVVAGTFPPGDPEKLRRSAVARGAALVEEAHAAIEARARDGDPEAAYRLGIWNLVGDEPLTASRPAAARSWLQRAASQDHAAARQLLERLGEGDPSATGRPAAPPVAGGPAP